MNIQSVLKMYYRDKWAWFLIPNLILFSVFSLNLIISLFIPDDDRILYWRSLLYLCLYASYGDYCCNSNLSLCHWNVD